MKMITVTPLRSLRDKSVGLIGKKRITPVSFTTRWGIHTYGVPSPIDVLILDQDNRVVKLTRALPPNRIFFWNPKYERVVELPAGEITAKKIMVGDVITLRTPAGR